MIPTREPTRFPRDLLSRISQYSRLVPMILFLLTLTAEGLPPGSIEAQVIRHTAGEQFDFIGWELEATLKKLLQGLVAPQRYMDETARHDFFLDHLRSITDIRSLNAQIDRLYTDPAVEDPEMTSADLRSELAALRRDTTVRQLLAEAILEEQTSCTLVDAGFGTLGQEFPPVGVHFTPLPLLLIISPRDRIENVYSLSLRHGLDTSQQEAIEEQIDTDLDVSSYVTGIGGLAAYPSMLLEFDSLTWAAEVTAHEWTHHYLTLRPLGWNYAASGAARTINETTASIVGQEVGRMTVARYYPEFLPPEPEPVPEESDEEAAPPPEPPAFDFRLEMRQTRIRVDELLAEGRIEEAEAYMEERRQVFIANGFMLRKLNQAYFAFHGAYAAEAGAAGEDPVGPAVRALREQSPTLHAFVTRVARVTTLEELQMLLED